MSIFQSLVICLCHFWFISLKSQTDIFILMIAIIMTIILIIIHIKSWSSWSWCQGRPVGKAWRRMEGGGWIHSYLDFTRQVDDADADADADATHSKSGKVCGVCFFSDKKSAEKVRTSRHQNFATKVRKSIKSLKMHHLKAKCIPRTC